ncbi:MAG: type II secretion system F family protein [Epsilonproteobacteria bacterium]|nr:type II secretion system protein F [Campylobacterota bacterium]NPA56534.1 type II secretion system F family protein [Campylobacterota bacterium]
MKYFNVVVLHKGRKDTFLIQSNTKREALTKAKLKANGGVVVKVEETSPPLEETLNQLKNELLDKLSKKAVNRQDLIASIRQLAVMTNAGIPLHDALLEISRATSNNRLRYIFEEISENINAGISFSHSLERYKNELGSLSVTMIELGERTGDMSHALFTLADILEQIDENVRKFKKALRYPLITIGAMGIAFVILISFVVPKFKAIFAKLHADLPLPTKILLWLEHAFNTYGPYLLAGLFITIFTVKYLYKTNEEFKYKMDTFMLKVYLLKDIIYYSQLTRFMLVFSELIKAGIPVVDALENSVSMIDNAYMKEKLYIVKQMVEKGSSIRDAFKETGLFESMILQMVAAGEASGQLDAMLEKVTEYYAMKFDYILDNLSTYIEPIMLAVIAALVLLLALGIFLPMWDLASAVKGHR